MSRRRQLSDEERELWRGFARSVRPLRPADGLSGGKPAAPVSRLSSKTPRRPAPSREALPTVAKKPPLAPLDRRLKQRVARGREPIEARIDLHGFTQTQAHTALLRFLQRAQANGLRNTLVVTGKGFGKTSNSDDYVLSRERGVLKRQVPLWLALPEFRSLIVGFEDAHIDHGGEGALYVRLRRQR